MRGYGRSNIKKCKKANEFPNKKKCTRIHGLPSEYLEGIYNQQINKNIAEIYTKELILSNINGNNCFFF